ncbi:Non-specific serine/threonine protein kinase [Forsythia ovata]|uniref:Non-specific serine/threonine protein kinase n=1 Tax=Forsythia ovata TaxID=205694 RepID=A0ABD1XAN3_9LAMI
MINYEDENEHSGQRKSVSSEKRHREDVFLPSCDKYREEGDGRDVSKSPGQSRGRSLSQSIHGEASDAGRQVKKDDAYYIDSKHRSDSDDERMSVYNRDYRHGRRDVVRDKEREHSSNRHNEGVDRHHSKENRNRYREGRDRERDRAREKERERKNAKERQRTRLQDGDRAVKGRDREKDKERERGSERENERVRVSERDRERIKENSRNRNRD